MCTTCGCGTDAEVSLLNLQTKVATPLTGSDPDEHVHADGTRHSHPHHHPHEHASTHGHDILHAESDHRVPTHDDAHGHAHANVHAIEQRILAKNDALADRNRAWFSELGILAVNLISAPGSGKTTLLERTIAHLQDQLPLFVIEGDQASANDGERIRNAGAPVVQINTGTGCHLDAAMVARALPELAPGPASIVFIENVGNLVCPALFDLGERAKAVIFSVTEGEDKPLKYPHIYRAASVVVISKIDLAPHLDFALDQAVANVRVINRDAPILQVSARTGEGLGAWHEWLRSQTDGASGVLAHG